MRKEMIKNLTMNGAGLRKYYWYIIIEFAYLFYSLFKKQTPSN